MQPIATILPPDAEAPSARTVLIVEDDPWIRPLLAELLQDEGYRVLQADTGEKGLSLALENPPNVVLLDLRLPDTSGLDVLRELRANEATADVRVLVISAEVDQITRTILARQAQRADGVIEKPLDISQLFEQLEETASS